MRIKKNSLVTYRVFAAITTLAILVVGFQNCGNSKTFTAAVKINSISGTEEVPQYAELKLGESASFPPLKLFFVVDNSGTMQANQINLSNAFSEMFSNQNADNLSPFESTAYVFNTAQMSIGQSDESFAKLPINDLKYFEQMSWSNLLAGPRSYILNGDVPGDLVGYRSVVSNSSGLNAVSYIPSPVSLFMENSGRSLASTKSFKTRDGSVEEFSKDFTERLKILDPARSAMDPVKKTGVLDMVIDKESGLCAVARVMRNKSDYIKDGDIAAFIVVSDEEDSDIKGLSCIQSVKDYTSEQDFFDGYCINPKTKLSYRELNPSPNQANCKVDYSTGFTYTYSYTLPKTDVSYYIQQRDYTVRQYIVNYSAVTHTYSQPQVVISYYTKAPTYEVPQSTISYYKKVESCDIRDGVKFNCTYTFPQSTTSVFAESFSNCSSFATGKIPSDALLGDSSHPLTCNKLANKTLSGSCTSTDTTKLNCKQNYSPSRLSLAAIDGVVSSTCESFATSSGKLPANAVLNDAGFEVQCASTVKTNIVGSGLCSPNKADCKEAATGKTSVAIDGIPTDASASACMAYAVKNKSKLDSNALLENASYPVTCAESNGRTVTNQEGRCSTLSSAYKNCSEHAAATPTKGTHNGVVASTCLSFIQTAIGPSRVIATSPAPTCALSSAVQTVIVNKTMNYNGTSSTYTPAANASCFDELKDYIAVNDGITTVTSCKVNSVVKSFMLHNTGKLCAQLPDPLSPCSTSAKRECIAQDVAAGDPYLSSLTQKVFAGEFTCNTKCSDTSFCGTQVGTIGENYKDCSVSDASTQRPFKKELYSNKNIVCNLDEKATPVVTRDSYRDIGSKIDYVAGAASESGIPNALANYIRDESELTFGANKPSVSVFVRQPGDSLGTNGSLGTAYNAFADLMGGEKRSVLSGAQGYAEALKSLSAVIKEKLARSFNVDIGQDNKVQRIWHRKAGSTTWGNPLDSSEWSAFGGTVTLNPNYEVEYGDEFRIEFF